MIFKMQRIVGLYVILSFLLGCGNPLEQPVPRTLDQIIADLKFPGSRVLVAAHRGDWRNAPENSIRAILYAAELGVDIVEIDLKKTKDGHLVLIHDETVDRTTDGTGRVSDFTLDSIRLLHLRNGIDRPTEEIIPTLEEAMLAAKGKVVVNLDKAYEYFPDILPILEKTGTKGQVIMKGMVTAEQLKNDLGNDIGSIMFMPVISLEDSLAWQKIADHDKLTHPIAFEFLFKSDTSKIISTFPDLNRKGTYVWVNSLWPSLCAGHDDDRSQSDPDANWGWLVDKGATIIQTDRPAELIKYLKNRSSR